MYEADADDIVDGFFKGFTLGAALLLESLEDVVVEGKGGSDAHDAFIIAS